MVVSPKKEADDKKQYDLSDATAHLPISPIALNLWICAAVWVRFFIFLMLPLVGERLVVTHPLIVYLLKSGNAEVLEYFNVCNVYAKVDAIDTQRHATISVMYDIQGVDLKVL